MAVASSRLAVAILPRIIDPVCELGSQNQQVRLCSRLSKDPDYNEQEEAPEKMLKGQQWLKARKK
jgi:hypothetical protein